MNKKVNGIRKVQDDRPKLCDSVIRKGELQRNLDKHLKLLIFVPIQFLFSSCLTEAFDIDIDIDRMQIIQTIITDWVADDPR